jgi:hypothetical protein
MPGFVFAIVVVAFLIVAVVLVRRTQRGAFVTQLPISPDEQVVLEEASLKLAHRFRKRAFSGGWTVTRRVRSVLTDRRIVLATGGAEGKHEFVIQTVVDYTAQAPEVPETGYPAYLRKFGLANGYPTYYCTAAAVTVDGDSLHIVVPFPEAGDGWGKPPELRLSTPNAARYREVMLSAAREPSASH